MQIDPSVFIGIICAVAVMFGFVISIKVDIASIREIINAQIGYREEIRASIKEIKDEVESLKLISYKYQNK